MRLHISTEEAVPIYKQIVTQIKHMVASQRLRPRDEVPPIRVLAEQLLINPNTVARAYRDLQNDGVLATVRGTGLEITTDAKSICQSDRESLIRERLRSVLLEAYQSGLSPSAIQDTVNQLIQELSRHEGDHA